MIVRTNEAEQSGARRRMANFLLVWAGQFVSLIGPFVTSFALGVWVYQRTGSDTVCFHRCGRQTSRIPISPLAGIAADRWDRRQVMIFSDTGGLGNSLHRPVDVCRSSRRLAYLHRGGDTLDPRCVSMACLHCLDDLARCQRSISVVRAAWWPSPKR